MSKEKKSPEIRVIRDQHYREYIVNGVYGGFTGDGNFRMLLYNQQTMPSADFKDVMLERALKCNLVMTPATLKTLIKWLEDHLAKFEDQVGEIKLAEKVETLKEDSDSADPSIR